MGTLFVVAGPSGVGKGTLVKRLLELDRGRLAVSISATTRPPRASEVDGRDYRFVSDAEFDSMISRGALLEWAEVFGHRYGTPREAAVQMLEEGSDVVLEIDVQGAAQVRVADPEAVLILIEPPSLDELARRLRSRGTEDEATIRRRLDAASEEMEQASWFDHVVLNDDVDRAASEVAAIIEASRRERRATP